MGTPSFAVPSLQALCKSNFLPELIVTQPARRRRRGGKSEPSPVGKLALANDLQLLESENICSGDDFQRLVEVKPDLICVVAFGQFLKRNVLSLPKHGCLNVHPSALPKYRGAAPIQWQILNGERESAISIIQLVSKMDAGPIVLQEPFTIDSEGTSAEVLEQAAKAGADTLVRAMHLYQNGQAPPLTLQDDEAASFAPMLTRAHGVVNFERSAREVVNQIRAVQPWPKAETWHSRGGQLLTRLIVNQARVISVETANENSSGTILRVDESGLEIACATGSIEIAKVQVEGKPPRLIGDFLRGYELRVGDTLGPKRI